MSTPLLHLQVICSAAVYDFQPFFNFCYSFLSSAIMPQKHIIFKIKSH